MSIQNNLQDDIILQEVLDEIALLDDNALQEYVGDIDIDDIDLQDNINCERCNKPYEEIGIEWCKSCQINDLKEKFTDWTSGNENVDNFIQEIQLGIDEYDDIVFEWIPYDQFDDVKKLGEDDHYFVAIWKDGLLMYDLETKQQYF